MDRKSEMEKCIEDYRLARSDLRKTNLPEIKIRLQPVFCEKLDFLIKDQIYKSRGVVRNIEVFYLCRLLSSDYTGSYESVLGISNDLLFLDKHRSETYWCPKYIFKDLKNDMKEIERNLRKRFVRIEEYELFHMMQLLFMDDWDILKDCFRELAQEQLHMLSKSSLDFKPKLKIMSGYYMDQLQLELSINVS